ncbi:MAG: hypothetical protein V4772_18480 [Pseudomonadota bacterium]
MKTLILAALISCLSGLAFCAEYDQSIEVQFPDKIGNLRFKSKNEFPQKGLGVSYGYERPRIFVRGAVFIYTGGLTSIPAGAESAVVQKHFDQVIRDVKSLEALGQAKAVTLSPEPTQITKYPGCGPQFLWRSYMMDLDGQTTLKAYTYLTAINGNFVKLRITLNAETPQDQRDADLFVSEVRKVLGRCK